MPMTAGELDVALRAKDGVTPVMNGVGKSASSLGSAFGGLGNIITAAIAVTAVAAVVKFAKSAYDSFQQTGEAIKTLTRMTGVSVQGASILTEQWKLFGVSADGGANAMKFLSKNMEAAIGGSKPLTAAFKETGLSIDDLKGKSSADIMLKLRDSMSQMTDKTQRTALAMQLFGRGGMAMMPWLDRSPAAVDAVTKSMHSLGLVWGPTQMAEFEKVKGEQRNNALLWDAIKMRAGEAITQVVGVLLPLIGKGLALLLPVFDKVRTGISMLMTGLGEGFKKPWAEMSAGQKVLTVLADAVKTWANGWKLEIMTVVNFFRAHWTEIVKVANDVMNDIGAGVTWLHNTFKPAIDQIVLTVRAALAAMAKFWTDHKTQIMAVLTALWSVVKVIWNLIVGVIKGALTVISGVIQVVMALLRGDWGAAWNGVKEIVRGAWEVIKSVIKGALALVVDILKLAWDAIKLAASAAWNAIKKAISDVWTAIKTVVSGAVGDVKSTMSAAWNAIKGAVSSAWSAISGAVSSGVGDVVKFVKGLPGKVVNALGNLGSLLLSAGRDLIAGLWNGISSAVGGLLSKIQGVASSIGHAFKSALGIGSPSTVFHEFGLNLMQGLGNGVNAGADLAVGAVAGVAGAVSGVPMQGLAAGAGSVGISIQIGTVYATSPAQAQASTTDIANQIIAKLATAKRNTARGAP